MKIILKSLSETLTSVISVDSSYLTKNQLILGNCARMPSSEYECEIVIICVTCDIDFDCHS